MPIELLKPTLAELPAYADALKRGWSPDHVRGAAAAEEQLRKIAAAPSEFVAGLDDPEAKGPPFPAPDGTLIPRLPGYNRWIWDGDFCGSINFRWQHGHIGYGVVPWKQGRGYATQALKLLLPDAKRRGLTYVELTTDPDNIPSQKVITSNGGNLVERFTKSAAYGSKEALRWRIDL